MTQRQHRLIQIPGFLLLIYLCVAQAPAALDYDLGIMMGSQEPREVITGVGVAFFQGFALADVVVYIPLLFLGLLGHVRRWKSYHVPLIAALGITLYWPITCLAAVVFARGAEGWALPADTEQGYWIVLTLIFIWVLWALITVWRDFAAKAGSIGE